MTAESSDCGLFAIAFITDISFRRVMFLIEAKWGSIYTTASSVSDKLGEFFCNKQPKLIPKEA